MSTTTTSQQDQLQRARAEVESSLAAARVLCDQWRAASKNNPTNLTKKEVDNISKTFKNRLLTVKWDCEDLEELVSTITNKEADISLEAEIVKTKQLVECCKEEISDFMNQLDEGESNSKMFGKHGLTFPSNTANAAQATMTSILQSTSSVLPDSKYEKLTNTEAEEVQFDKTQVATSVSIFNNALYDHMENFQDRDFRNTSNSSQVFNNLSRPLANVYVNPNENEMILDMLETEYYSPPAGLESNSRFNNTVRKLLDLDRNKFLGTIAVLFSFPLILLVFLGV